jgi:biopolymer transport protein ExbB
MKVSFSEAIFNYFEQGGFVMWPLVASTIVLWYVLGYRFVTLQRGTGRSLYVLLEEYRKESVQRTRGVIDGACVLAISLSRRRKGSLRPVLDDAFQQVARELGAGKSLINSLVGAAPLLGLLGTVTGMIETFDSMADQAFFSQSGGIAGGIAEALFTTQMGLVVAVPGVIIGRLLDRRQTLLEDELDRIKDILCADAVGTHEVQAS